MKEVFIGETVKRRRLELGLTQEELCEGICEPITVSRLENGRQTPSRNRLNALLERLDLPADRYYALLSENEKEVEALQREIVSCNIRFSQSQGQEKEQIREAGLAAHKKLEAILDQDDTISRQLIMESQVLLGREDGPYAPGEKKDRLLEAIRLTAPSFDPRKIGRGLYTLEEVRMIDQLAAAYGEMGEHPAAIDIRDQLYQYMQKHYANVTQSRSMVIMVAMNLARELDATGQYRRAVETAEQGRKMCLDYGYFFFLPELLHVMARSWHFLGEDEKSNDLYHQVYYLYQVRGDIQNQEAVRSEAGTYLDIAFEC